MAYNVQITKKAENDLDSFVKYISENLKNPKAALNLLNDFLEQKNYLAESPYM